MATPRIIRSTTLIILAFVFSIFLSPCSRANETSKSLPLTVTGLPHKNAQDQWGYNDCGTGSSQSSRCQTLYVNHLGDFCLFGSPVPNSTVPDIQQKAVAYCILPGRGTRLLSPNAIIGAHFVRTATYIQITGLINGPLLGIKRGDAGAEFSHSSPHQPGNPIGALVFTTAFGGPPVKVDHWLNFMGDGEFCIRLCNPTDPDAAKMCSNIYDKMGCTWVMPGNYKPSFDSCLSDSLPPPGIYKDYIYHQGDPRTPDPHPVPTMRDCHTKHADVKPVVHTNNITTPKMKNPTNYRSSNSTEKDIQKPKGNDQHSNTDTITHNHSIPINGSVFNSNSTSSGPLVYVVSSWALIISILLALISFLELY